jgi:hypothetical protein
MRTRYPVFRRCSLAGGFFRRHEVTVVPYHTIAFSQQKLRAALRRTVEQEPPFTYGFVVHARQHNEQPALGVITPHGESLALNERLLRALDGMALWLFGHARIALDTGTVLASTAGGRADAADLPLASMLMRIATVDTHATNAGTLPHLVQVEAVVSAASLVQPLVILTHHRPPGFPR